MIGIDKNTTTLGLLLFGLGCLTGNFARAAEEDPNEPLIQMVIELVSDADHDMRALGLQQVREEVPGEAATKRFAEVLPKLPPDGQVGLLEALGDRQDKTARPDVLDMLTSQEDAVRAAALGALGMLGSASDVALLSEKAATGSNPEREAARRSLIRLRGDDVNAALVAAMSEGKPDVRVELLGALAARNATETLPTVLKSAQAPEACVRLAALGALRFIADEDDTEAMVSIVKTTGEPAERRKAELALLAICGRGRQKCADALVSGLADADEPSRVVLLHGLARAGGAKALAAIVGHLEDDDESVQDEAMRMLSVWPDAAAASHLLTVAGTTQNLRHQVLAIRGLVRLATPQGDKPADLKTLTEAMNLAKRPQEKRLVLGVAGGIAATQSLALAASALDDPALVEEAGLAVVMIAEKAQDGNKDQIQIALEKVGQLVKSQQIRRRAQKLVESL